MTILEFFFGYRLKCSCCYTTKDVDEFGIADTAFCYPCAEEHGYWSSKWKHECKAKKV